MTCPSGAMDSASDFGSEGCGFEFRLGFFDVLLEELPAEPDAHVV
jgi:hypothetical protein